MYKTKFLYTQALRQVIVTCWTYFLHLLGFNAASFKQ